MKVFLTCISVLVFISCSTEGQNVNSLDSISIMKSSLHSKLFTDGIPAYSDTIYLIKNEHYHQAYPLEIGKLKIVYIDNVLENKTFNRPDRSVDGRERFEITNITKSGDTVYFDVFNCGASESYAFKLKKTNDTWKIIAEQVSIGNLDSNF